MPLQTEGPISFTDIATEFDVANPLPLSLLRDSARLPDGQVSVSDFFGLSNFVDSSYSAFQDNFDILQTTTVVTDNNSINFPEFGEPTLFDTLSNSFVTDFALRKTATNDATYGELATIERNGQVQAPTNGDGNLLNLFFDKTIIGSDSPLDARLCFLAQTQINTDDSIKFYVEDLDTGNRIYEHLATSPSGLGTTDMAMGLRKIGSSQYQVVSFFSAFFQSDANFDREDDIRDDRFFIAQDPINGTLANGTNRLQNQTFTSTVNRLAIGIERINTGFRFYNIGYSELFFKNFIPVS